jgi:hypothetical protein
MPRVLRPLLLVVVLAATAGSVGVGTAEASVCSRALIHDWYVDGRVDQTYAVHCYREALNNIPEDQIVYGSLRDDLTRALLAVTQDNGGDVGPDTMVPPAPGSDPSDGDGSGSSGHDESFFGKVARALGPDTADSIPVPLLVLGGLALLLIAAAGVSFAARRMQARRAPTPPPPAPPVA